MKRKFLTEEDFDEFLKTANYACGNELDLENARDLQKPVKSLCKAQIERFEGEKRCGNDLNMCMYLLGKYYGFVMTCKNRGTIHFAFVYPKVVKNRTGLFDSHNKPIVLDGEAQARDKVDIKLCVCDPKLSKVEDKKYFDIDLDEYVFPAHDRDGNEIMQEYIIYSSMNPNNSKNSLLDFIKTRNTNRYTYKANDTGDFKQNIIKFRILSADANSVFQQVENADAKEYKSAIESLKKK